MTRAWSQTRLGGARQYGKMQRAEMIAQEVPSEQEEEHYCVCNRTGTDCPEVVLSPSLSMLKNRLDAIMCHVV